MIGDQAQRLREMAARLRQAVGTSSRCRVLAVTSGKGGVGKSSLAVNLGLALAGQGYRVTLVDADLGMANAEILVGAQPRYNLSHVVQGRCSLAEAVHTLPGQLNLVAGGAGSVWLARLSAGEMDRLVAALGQLAESADYLVLDTGAGIGGGVGRFLAAADDILLVTTPEPTSLADAYGVLKVLAASSCRSRIYLVVNQASISADTERLVRLQAAAEHFLGLHPAILGAVPRDAVVAECVERVLLRGGEVMAMTMAQVDLWQRYRRDRDHAAWEELVRGHLRLVNYMAGRLAMGLAPGTDLGELQSHGVFGLLDAVEHFDPGRGVRFETYAIPWIRGAILAGLKANHWSPQLLRRVKALESATLDLEIRLGRLPTAGELATHMGISVRALARRRREVGYLAALSLDEAAVGLAGGEDSPLHERLADPNAPDPELEVLDTERRALLVGAVDGLSEKERRVVELYYFEGLTLAEIGQVLRLSTARVSQLHSKAIFRLRGKLGRLKAQLV